MTSVPLEKSQPSELTDQYLQQVFHIGCIPT